METLLAIKDETKRPLYLIVELAVSKLQELGLSVTPDRHEAVPGHCLLPELNSQSWATDKAIWLPKVEELANLAAERVTVGIALAMIIWGSLLCPSHSASK